MLKDVRMTVPNSRETSQKCSIYAAKTEEGAITFPTAHGVMHVIIGRDGANMCNGLELYKVLRGSGM